MQLKEYRCVGLVARVQVPATLEEYDKNAGRVNAALEDAVDNIVYRGVLSGVRADFCDAVEKASGIARKKTTVKKGEKDVTTYDESEATYVERAKGELKLDDTAFVTRYQPVMDTVVAAESNAFDASETVRTGKPKKLAQSYIDAAIRVFANGNEDKNVRRILKESGTQTIFVPVEGDEAAQAAARATNIERLGWSIKANEAFKDKERQALYA